MSEILYRLVLSQPHTHRFWVEMTIPELPGPLVLVIPAWMPGAYKLVDHARNVRRVAAYPLSGPPANSARTLANHPLTRTGALEIERLDMHTWRVHGAENGAIVRYEVFADKLMIHEGQVNADHAFLNGSAAWLVVQGASHLPCRVRVDAPEGWSVACALEPCGDGEFLAAGADVLLDAPLEAGNFETIRFASQGVTWDVVWHGSDDDGNTLDRIASAVVDLAQEAVRLLGPAPFERYTLFFHDCEEPGYLNGLEHRTSMAMQGPLEVLSNPDPFFTMVAHEILHAWNGQRMAPQGLFRPGCDYFRPAHTTALWVVEGWTEYYASLLMLRAGRIDAPAYLTQLAESLDSYYRTPGRRCSTLEESSFITWNFGDDRWNGAINYYLKGLLAAFALDVEIRVRTQGQRSLDDLMRLMWQEFGDRLPYQPIDVERLAARVAGADLTAFFDLHLRSTEDPDYAAIAAKLGLVLSFTERASLGLRASGPDGALKVEGIEAFGAAENAGLQAGDLLVALDQGPSPSEPALTASGPGQRVSESALTAIARESQPGDLLTIQFFRGDDLLRTTLRLGASRRHSLALDPGQSWLAADYLAPKSLTRLRAQTVAPSAPA